MLKLDILYEKEDILYIEEACSPWARLKNKERASSRSQSLSRTKNQPPVTLGDSPNQLFLKKQTSLIEISLDRHPDQWTESRLFRQLSPRILFYLTRSTYCRSHGSHRCPLRVSA